MIVIGSMQDFKREDYDEVWFIIRSVEWMSNKHIFKEDGIYHVPELSPSKKLFFDYLSLKKNNNWNEKSFEKEYLPVFMKEINTKEAREKLNLLWKKSKTKKILLICACEDELLCHRSVVGGILYGVGTDVVSTTRNIKDYLKYYHMFNSLKKND